MSRRTWMSESDQTFVLGAEAMALSLDPPIYFGIPYCTLPDIAILNL
jgi:hypothetical protein